MKRDLKAFMVGLVVASILMSGVVFAGPIRQKVDVVFNSINISVDGNQVKSDNILYKDTTYVPLREVAEMLGKNVGWDETTRTANIGDSKDEKGTEPSESYSRNNPAPVGVTQKFRDKYSGFGTVKEHDSVLDMTIKEVLRGQAALDQLAQEGLDNVYVKEDHDLVIAKITANVVSSKGDESVLINSGHFRVFSEDNISYTDTHVQQSIKNEFRTSTLFEGSNYEGYMQFFIPKSMQKPKLVYFKGHDSELWFELFE